jgi:hypothetical protein
MPTKCNLETTISACDSKMGFKNPTYYLQFETLEHSQMDLDY